MQQSRGRFQRAHSSPPVGSACFIAFRASCARSSFFETFFGPLSGLDPKFMVNIPCCGGGLLIGNESYFLGPLAEGRRSLRSS